MKILFINPAMEKYTRQVSFPLGMMSIATYLNANGHNAKIIDRTIKTTDIRKELESFAPDIVGVSVFSLKSFTDAEKVSLAAKEYGAKVVWGGVFASLDAEFVFSNIDIDFISVGEGEITWLELCDTLENGDDFRKVKGLAYRENGNVIYSGEREFADLSLLPPVDFTLVDADKYLGPMYGCKKTALLYISKGCYGKCTFCFNAKFHKSCHRAKPVEIFLDEVRYLMKNHGVDCIYFADELFGTNKEEVYYLCNKFIESGLGFKWVAQTRAGYFSRDEYMLMKEAGCVAIDFGIESGSPSMLKTIKKNIPYDKIKETFEYCNDAGIISLANFIIGFPDETEEQFRETIEMAKSINSTQQTFFFFMPGPGSELYEKLVSEKKYTPPKTFREYTDIKFFYSPEPNFSRVPSKELKVVRAHFLWKGFSRKHFSDTARKYDIAKKDIEDVLRQFRGHDLKFAFQLFISSVYEFSDIFIHAHFFPKIKKKYSLR